MSEPRSVKVTVTFEAVVLTVESCTIGSVVVPMAKQPGNKWSGSASIVPSPNPRPFRLVFRAPSNTDYKVTVKARGKNVFEDEGTSDKTIFPIEGALTVPLAADA
jgi:hypothetical protein